MQEISLKIIGILFRVLLDVNFDIPEWIYWIVLKIWRSKVFANIKWITRTVLVLKKGKQFPNRRQEISHVWVWIFLQQYLYWSIYSVCITAVNEFEYLTYVDWLSSLWASTSLTNGFLWGFAISNLSPSITMVENIGSHFYLFYNQAYHLLKILMCWKQIWREKNS